MAVIVSTGNVDLETASAFYRSDYHNLDWNGSRNNINGTTTFDITFTDTGDLKGIIFAACSYTTSRTFNNNMTFEFQENVASVWTTRLTKTLARADINPDYADADDYKNLVFNIDFGSTYTYDTSASKWRLNVYADSYSGGTLDCFYSDTTAHVTMCTYCDTLVSFSSGDTVVVRPNETVTINATTTLGPTTGVGASNKIAAWVASTGTLAVTDAPAAAITLSTEGAIVMGSYGTFQVASEANPIPLDKRFNLHITDPGYAYRAITGRFDGGTTECRGWHSIKMYGAYPTYVATTLDGDHNTGVSTLTVADAVDWDIGDEIAIGKCLVKNRGDTTVYTITNISGTSIDISPSISSYHRKDGGHVINLTKRGISVDHTSGTTAIYLDATTPLALDLIGVYFYHSGCTGYGYYGTTSVGINSPPSAGFQEKNHIKYCSGRNTDTSVNTTIGLLYSYWTPPKGAEIYHNVTFRNFPMGNVFTPRLPNYTGGTIEYWDNISIANWTIACPVPTTYTSSAPQNYKMDFRRNYTYGLYGSNSGGWVVYGTDTIFYDNYIWGASVNWDESYPYEGGLVIAGCINGDIQRTKIEYCGTGMIIGYGAPIGTTVTDTDFSADTYPNTEDIVIAGADFVDLVVDNCFNMTYPITASNTSLLSGTRISFTDFEGTTKNDFTYTPDGILVRTGDSLADTTVHSAGTAKYAIRAENNSIGNLDWTFECPVGDISGLDMTVVCWVKINAAAYYAGTHTNPQLRVRYDKTTWAYAEAVDSTDWQILSVTITPTTSYGQITITLRTNTDATGSDAYVYADDFSILYPAGYALNLGGLDLWSDGLPITPPISTSIAAADVWAYDLNNAGTGTAGAQLGQKVLTSNNFLALK